MTLSFGYTRYNDDHGAKVVVFSHNIGKKSVFGFMSK